MVDQRLERFALKVLKNELSETRLQQTAARQFRPIKSRPDSVYHQHRDVFDSCVAALQYFPSKQNVEFLWDLRNKPPEEWSELELQETEKTVTLIREHAVRRAADATLVSMGIKTGPFQTREQIWQKLKDPAEVSVLGTRRCNFLFDMNPSNKAGYARAQGVICSFVETIPDFSSSCELQTVT